MLRGEGVAWPTEGTPEFEESFFEASRHQGVLALLNHELRRTRSSQTVPTALRERLRVGAAQQAALELSRKSEAIRVLRALADHHIPSLLMKGGSLAYSHYASPDLRSRVDTDVLIRETDRNAALEILEGLGYKFPRAPSGISSAVNCTRQHHAIDLHWGISNVLLFARVLTFDELYIRSVAIRSLAPGVRAPSDVDALVIACIHRASHLPERFLLNGVSCSYGNRLIWLYDIHLLASGMSTTQWREFVTLTQQKKLSSFCLDGLKKTRELFESPVPLSVTESLSTNQRDERIPLGKLRSRRQFFISDFRVLPTWGDRFALLKKRLFPDPAYIRSMYNVENDKLLPLLYLRRVARRFYELVFGS